jgi:S-adenosylmethionine synthetase
MTMESVAGKNPISHVGKLYNLVAGLACARVVGEVPGVTGAQCFLVSQIGRPVKEPQVAEIGYYAAPGEPGRMRPPIAAILHQELNAIDTLWKDVIAGGLAVDRWPFRAS